MNTFNELFEPEDQLDRLAEVLKYGRPTIQELVDTLNSWDPEVNKDVEQHNRDIFAAAADYSLHFLCASHNPKMHSIESPRLMLLAYLKTQSWSIEEFNQGLLEIET